VAILEQELDPEAIREKLNAFVNIIGKYMTTYSEALEMEHRGSQHRLDIRNLTVVAGTLNGAVPLFRMGSGENWVGYHVLSHLALHKLFRQKERPVPGSLIFDQPSQAHYPPERDADGSLDVLGDEDQKAVTQLYKLIFDAAEELAPNLQIIVMDHADLKPDRKPPLRIKDLILSRFLALHDAKKLEYIAKILGFTPSVLSHILYKPPDAKEYTSFEVPKRGIRPVTIALR